MRNILRTMHNFGAARALFDLIFNSMIFHLLRTVDPITMRMKYRSSIIALGGVKLRTKP